MTTSWERYAGETEAWYDRFKVYLYMGPDRTLAAAHDLVTRLAKGAAHPQLSSWRRAAQRNQWQERAAAYDAELRRKVLASDERLLMVAELLHQVYAVLRHADMPALSKEEARQLLPTLRLFFRDLLQFHQTAAAQLLVAKEGENSRSTGSAHKGSDTELSADDLVKFLTEIGGWQALLADIERVTAAIITEDEAQEEKEVAAWRPLRDVLAQFYPDEASARRMAAQADLDSTRIHFSARAVDTWHAILTEAAHAGHLEHVIEAVQEEYGTNPELARAIARYRTARSPGKKDGDGKRGSKSSSKRGGGKRKA